jgi:tetratricopeptide (TPR) repeat protein
MRLFSQIQRWALQATYRYHRSRGHSGGEDRALRRLGRLHEARGDLDSARECYERAHAERDLARLLRQKGDEREAARRYRELRCYYLAAEASARAGDWQQAARSFHLSGAFVDAARCWERWLEGPEAAQLGEEQLAPVLAEVALCYDRLGQSRRAAELYRRALEILDVRAAAHEAGGLRAQARTAYLAIAHIGHSKGTYESISCGLAGAIRVGKSSDGAAGRLLGYYDDFIHYALRFGEYACAAELCVEAAELRAEEGGARGYLVQAGDNWLRNGDFLYVQMERPELAETSYHAAIECYLRAREHGELAACYRRLAVVAEEGRREEFARLAQKLEAEPDRTGRERREQDLETLLGVEPDASRDEVQRAYFQAIRRHPPDTDFERFDALTQAFEVLSDEKKRARYRQLLGRSR